MLYLKNMRYLCSFLFISFIVFSEAPQGKVKVGILELYPWGFIKDSEISGIQPDQFNLLSKLSGIQFEYKILPLKRAFKYLRTGKIDLISAIKRPEISEYADEIDLVKVETFYLFLRKGLDFTPKTIKSLDYIVALLGEEKIVKEILFKKYSYTSPIRAVGSVDQIIQIANKQASLKAFVVPSFRVKNLKGKTPFNFFVIYKLKGYIYISKKSKFNTPEFRLKIKSAQAQMKKKKTLEKIESKYTQTK